MTSNTTNICGESHNGYKRENNEDRFLINEFSEISILVVADGMGGHVGGEIAAQIIIDVFQEYKFSKPTLKKDLKMAFRKAEELVHHEIKKNIELDGMGSTATAAVFGKGKIFWIHIGDSRMYLLRGKKIKQITTDHTFIQDLIDDGTLTFEQAKTHPLRNVLDQCIGCDEIQPESGMFNIQKNDRLLLCSDGLTTHLSDLQIESILKTNSTKKTCHQLIRTALKMGGSDNVTVIVKDFY